MKNDTKEKPKTPKPVVVTASAAYFKNRKRKIDSSLTLSEQEHYTDIPR